jgi:hypothetical protein
MKKWILRITATLLIIFAVICIGVYLRLKDNHPGFKVDISIPATSPSDLSAGFAAITITPTVADSWTDVNHDFKFDEANGDTYTDKNGNGKFDPVWMAGFHNNRPHRACMMTYGHVL